MFKIESYITPIIINYIDKYVKDFRPQNAQVSLWGGEVSFQNLDIRLDVLQEELQLPLNIVSGHIHELTVRVPWTKIASEPIQINVNTIEFAVRLKSDESDKKTKETTKPPQTAIVQEPPGYMASLINKIANNISVKLNNIIFKYIEDDIVLSMNIQTFSIDSADENWNAAFIDINAVKVILRKVININDLTICLDKRNAQGKIDVCQEPILYRCSLQARMLRKYNLSTAHVDSHTRIDVFTDNIDFKISVQQFPMLIRIYYLFRMLREFQANLPAAGKRSGVETVTSGGQIVDATDGSYTTWIWNMLPEIFPVAIEDEQQETYGHIVHNGFYATNITITLKSQEIISNSIIQSNTVYKYSPILRISMGGVSFDTISVGNKWCNIRGGISYIGVFPLTNCTCSRKHNLTSIFVAGERIKGDDNDDHFLVDSLRDPQSCENQNQHRFYNTDFQTHMQLNTERNLLERCPALAIDIVSHKRTLDDGKSRSSLSLSSRDTDTMVEEYFMRVVCGAFVMKVDSSLYHLYQTLDEQYQQYTYVAPYAVAATADTLSQSQLTPPSTEDYESLVECIPLRKTFFYFNDSTIEYYHLNADHFNAIEILDFTRIPYFSMHLNRIELITVGPLYPDKLINTTCQLPDPMEKLKENCFIRNRFISDQVSMDLCFNQYRINVFKVQNSQIGYDTLIQPELWKITKMQHYMLEASIEQFRMQFNKPQLLLLLQIASSYSNSECMPNKNLKIFQSIDIGSSSLPIVEIHLQRFHAILVSIDGIFGLRSVIQAITAHIFLPVTNPNATQEMKKNQTIIFSNEHIDNDLIKCIIQCPDKFTAIKHPPILHIELLDTVLNFDPMLQQFLSYDLSLEKKCNVIEQCDEKAQRKLRKASKISRPNIRTESVHSNSMTSMSVVTSINKSKIEAEQRKFKEWFDIFHQTIAYADLKPLTIICPNEPLPPAHTAHMLQSYLNTENHLSITCFQLPNLTIRTSKFRNIQNCVQKDFPISLTENWMLNITSFPWNIEMNQTSCYTIMDKQRKIVLPSADTKLTLDLTSKDDESENGHDEISFVIHLDTTPIRLQLDLPQIKQVNESLQMISTIFQRPQVKPIAHLVEIPSTFYDAQINDLMCETTTSDKSSEGLNVSNDKATSKCHCLMQWTITKFSVILTDSRELNRIELLVDLEDIIMSVDKQSTYTKTKFKFGSINSIRKKHCPITGQIDVLHFISKSEIINAESQETVFEVVATTAIASNVHSRWGTTAKKVMGFRNDIETITELLVLINPIDLKLELDVLSVILAVGNEFGQSSAKKKENVNSTHTDAAHFYSVKDLPLIFLMCKDLKIWLPYAGGKKPMDPDVLIIKVDHINVGLSVENPIVRKPIRDDIYVKAAQLKMLNTPGSAVEDRQYAITFNKVSIVTGISNEISQFMHPVNNENPAFDWNNQTEKPSLNVNTIFNDFNVSITFAPAIVFQNVVVCGQAIELDCLSDLSINMTLADIRLLNDLSLCYSSIFQQTNTSKDANPAESPQPKASKQSTSRPFIDQHELSDSGFRSNLYYPGKSKDIEQANNQKHVTPHSWSFVGGHFTIQLYHDLDAQRTNPLILIKLIQPNMLTIVDYVEKVAHLSLFNLTIKFPDPKQPQSDDAVFNTYQGELDDSGIPAAFIELEKMISHATNETKIKCNIRRSIQIQLTPEDIDKLLSLNELIQQIIYPTISATSQPNNVRPIIRYNNVKELSKLIGVANSIELNAVKFSAEFMTSMERLLNITLFKWNCKIAVQKHPEQIAIVTACHSLLINTQDSMLLHPTSVRFDCNLSQEKWSKKLLIAANFTSNGMHFSMDPMDFWTFAKVQLDFWACFNRHFKWSKSDSHANKNDGGAGNDQDFNGDNLNAYELPSTAEYNDQNDEEYFQDDLRLGTFEYIITTSDNVMPLPYQIYLINGSPDMQICWKYPHPRTINFIQIFPIPEQIEANIKCRLEYFQESHNTFLPYVLFDIGSKKTNRIELPKQKLTASLWRIILIDPIASLVDIEDTQLLQDILTPRTIISFIRIDSMFNVDNIPVLQANIKFDRLSIAIMNRISKNIKKSLPEILSQYKLKSLPQKDVIQEFCRINIDNINTNINLYHELHARIYNELKISVDICDSSYMTMIPLIDSISIGNYVEINNSDGPNVFHLSADKLNIRFGPTAGNALVTAKNVWKPIETQKPLLTRYVICNSTSTPFEVGQWSTDSTIELSPNECHCFSFTSLTAPQRLNISILLDKQFISCPVQLNGDNRIKMLPVVDQKVLIVTTKKLSTTQKQIIVKGQIELINMSSEYFCAQYLEIDKENKDGISAKKSCMIHLYANGNGSFFEACDEANDAYLRLQLFCEYGNGWSGKVPLNKSTANSPWLVKVPHKSEQKFITFAVRIHCEPIEIPDLPPNQQPVRILAVIWPLFVIRSLLPMNLKLENTESKKMYEIEGKANCKDIQIAGTHSTEHPFVLHHGLHSDEYTDVILTYKNIDKKTFFSIPPEFNSIDDIISELNHNYELKWPSLPEKELRVERTLSEEMPTAPLCKFSASRPLSCTMKMDIIPWCLMINSLGFDIKIIDSKENKECRITSNGVAIPMNITHSFLIQVHCNGQWIDTQSIAITDEKQSYRQNMLFLPADGSVILTNLVINNQLIKICLTSTNENSARIITISPYYVICNLSKYQLKFHAFCVHRNEKSKYDEMERLIRDKAQFKCIPDNQNANTIFKGCDCSMFHNVSQNTFKSINVSRDFNFYLIIENSDRFLAAPILLNKPIIRTSFGLQGLAKNMSLALSVTQNKDQFFVSIYEDQFPFIEVDNQTNIEIYVAEADFADFSKSLKPKKSIHDENFQWNCTIPAYCQMNFTPPTVNERFPEKQVANIHLIFGCGNSKLTPDSNIRWSIPVETNKADEKYLALPLYGDIKFTSRRVNKSIKILLEHIDFKKEFNVKVVHTKLSSGDNQSNIVIDDEKPAIEIDSSANRPPNKSLDSKSSSASLKFDFTIFLKAFNVVLYDEDKDNLHVKSDIVSLYLDDFLICYTNTDRKLEIGFGDIQIDNNLFVTGKYDFPVVLCSQKDIKEDRRNSKANDTEKARNLIDWSEKTLIVPSSFLLSHLKNHWIDHQTGRIEILLEDSEFSAKEVMCSIQPLRIYIEDRFIAALFDFAIENLPSNVIYMAEMDENVECGSGELVVPKMITEQILSFLSEPLRLNRICIKPLSVLLSVHTCIRMYIALDHSPLHFAQFEEKNVYTTNMRLGYNIGMHYVSGAIFGAGWVVGSLEILGSPSGLARSVSSGLWDFVSMPVQGLMRGPWGVVLGITYGSASLIKNITAGTVNSVTKLAASVARNLDRMTLDDEHLERTEAMRRVRPMGITHGLSQGLTGFGINLLGAVSGIARHALEAKSSVEVFTGLGKGIIGVVAKPISGAAEFLALTGQGVLQTVGFNALPMPRDASPLQDLSHVISITKAMWVLTIDPPLDAALVAVPVIYLKRPIITEATIAITYKSIYIAYWVKNVLKSIVLHVRQTTASIDRNNSTHLILSDKLKYNSQQLHRKRILQFLSKTHVQTADSRLWIEEEIQPNSTSASERHVLQCTDPQVASYLENYIQFLTFNTWAPIELIEDEEMNLSPLE